jgi:MoaA/NifB/PqqE/SkfB family radical SAM enzyme
MNLANLNKLGNRIIRKIRSLLRGRRRDSAGSLNTRHDLAGRFCPNPFAQMDIYEDGKAYSCCSAWLPSPLGSITHSSVQDVWNSPRSQEIRASIFDGSFRFCDHRICPFIQAGSLPTLAEAARDPAYTRIIEERVLILIEAPVFINLCNDASCNLYCPSCRTQRIIHANGREYEKRQHLQDIITRQLFSTPTTRKFRVNITGSGDPFASAVFRNFLFNLEGSDFPNLSIHLQTNGVLLTPSNWQKLHRIHANIAIVLISFDAATEATYSITRKGGNWPILLDNTRRLGELRRAGQLQYLRLDFVVQKDNYREMAAFVALAKALGADAVAFSMVLDWGTWAPAEYRDKCIWKREHPEFGEFIAILQDPVFDEAFVFLGNLTEYRALAIEQAVA